MYLLVVSQLYTKDNKTFLFFVNKYKNCITVIDCTIKSKFYIVIIHS